MFFRFDQRKYTHQGLQAALIATSSPWIESCMFSTCQLPDLATLFYPDIVFFIMIWFWTTLFVGAVVKLTDYLHEIGDSELAVLIHVVAAELLFGPSPCDEEVGKDVDIVDGE